MVQHEREGECEHMAVMREFLHKLGITVWSEPVRKLSSHVFVHCKKCNQTHFMVLKNE